MKRISSRLSIILVVFGLFSNQALFAQQYHDAAAFGLKGNVKEVKVIHQKTGDLSLDIYGFSELSFGRDGRLERWNYLGGDYIIPDDGREGTLLVHGHHPSENASADIYFLYDRENSGNQVYGIYEIRHFKYDFLEELLYGVEDEEAYSVSVYSETADRILEDRIDFSIPPTHDAKKLIKEDLEEGGKLLGMELIRDDLSYYASEEGFKEHKSKLVEYKISAWDSHGNYTVLEGKDNQAYSIKRVITYWDEDPVKNNPSSAETHSVTAHEKKEEVTTNLGGQPLGNGVQDGLRAATPKELSVIDLITRPFGVLSVNSRKLPYDTVRSQLEGYGWVQDNRKDYISSSISTYSKDGYDMRYLGVVPQYAYAGFSKNQEYDILYFFSYEFFFNKAKKTQQFIDTLNSCEFARFAPGSAEAKMDDLYQRGIDVISKAEKVL